MSEDTEQKNKQSVRRENRVAAMQFLYMWDCNRDADSAELLTNFLSGNEEPREYYAFAETLIAGALLNIDAIDLAIEQSAKNWKISRIAKVDLAILRLAIFELLFRDDIPPIVSINEAIDIAKLYSGAESKRFVNGILDKVKSTLTRPLRTPNQNK